MFLLLVFVMTLLLLMNKSTRAASTSRIHSSFWLKLRPFQYHATSDLNSAFVSSFSSLSMSSVNQEEKQYRRTQKNIGDQINAVTMASAVTVAASAVNAAGTTLNIKLLSRFFNILFVYFKI